MATIRAKPFARRQSTNLPSPSLYTGSYDDATFSHTSPQLTKPINIPPHSSSSSHYQQNKRPTFYASYYSSYSEEDDDDNAVLDDSDAHSEDELLPSPMRRHSGAMSISQEDLSSCYDRAALRRETATHRARHHHHRQQQQQHKEAFALHEEWDCEVDGPHMALWTPETGSSSMTTTTSTATPVDDNTNNKRRRTYQDHQVSYIEGPMMCLWEP